LLCLFGSSHLNLGKENNKSSKKIHNDDTPNYLKGMKREVVPIVRDGNCFFKVFHLNYLVHRMIILLSIIVLWNLLVVINKFLQLISCLKLLMSPSTWATQLEVKGTATLLQMPIFYWVQNDTKGCYQWEVVYPIALENTQLPTLFAEATSRINHFELYYIRNLHYDAIVSRETCVVSLVAPELNGM